MPLFEVKIKGDQHEMRHYFTYRPIQQQEAGNMHDGMINGLYIFSLCFRITSAKRSITALPLFDSGLAEKKLPDNNNNNNIWEKASQF